jgi:hypothetical protein
MVRALLCAIVLTLGALQARSADSPEGERPYEMVWAGRTQDNHPPAVDFEDLGGWTVETHDAAATFVRSREQLLWGQSVGKLTYRAAGQKPSIQLRPPKPVPLATPFDCINFWVYGNNVGRDPSTPPVTIVLNLLTNDGRKLRISMATVRWREWWVTHHRLTPEEQSLAGKGAGLESIEVTGARNTDDRVLYFDNLSAYQETLPPLKFQPRPERGIKAFDGQSTGTNTGPGKLPFPTREETLLPDNLNNDFKVSLETLGHAYVFHYRGSDGHLAYRYEPKTGTLGDVTAQWDQSPAFQPMSDGGIYHFRKEDSPAVPPERIDPVCCRRDGNTVVSTWRWTVDGKSAEVTYTFRLWQKSLVVDVKCPGGLAGEVRVGRAVGLERPRLVTLPYLTCGPQRPAVVVSGSAENPLFLFALVDHCRSNGSLLWAVNAVEEQGATYNGGSRYLPKTDGRRNDCFERLFVTVSRRFEEILPNIPNPQSPWMHVTSERVWRAHGASNRDNDYALWKKHARYGMAKILITDHEVGWRDGEESFTFRTKAAPKKGGDEGQADYSRKIHALGFRYGIYNNYTDYAPVNGFWDENHVTRLSNGEWRHAWRRCYNPKPAWAVEMEAQLAPIIQQKFHLDTAYCDVHTAVTPWNYCDFDARVPGAGTFAATFYAYGEIMLHQKKTWNGPVYSEGNNHWYYCGLTDGNYGQDQVAKLVKNPWLVDFDLRKLHPLCCNFGMGNPGMFFGRDENLGKTPTEQQERLDHFLAATLAFGHTGFLVTDGGIANSVQSYFTLQQVHARYAQQTASEIRYADEQGRRLDTSAAVASGAFQRSQIFTRYSDGVEVTVNGHQTDSWKIGIPKGLVFGPVHEVTLPPNGWFVRSTKGEPLVAFSGLVDGHRADYVASPAYRFVNGRARFTRFVGAAADGQLIVLKRSSDAWEVIPVSGCKEAAVSFDGRTATAEALDEDGRTLGPASTRWSRGLVHIVPVANAFSYILRPGSAPARQVGCQRDRVVPGEVVSLTGDAAGTFTIPADAKPGLRIWHRSGDQWIDFTVVPLADARVFVASSVPDTIAVELLPHVPSPVDATIRVERDSQQHRLEPQAPLAIAIPLAADRAVGVRDLNLQIDAGSLRMQQKFREKTERVLIPLATMPESFTPGQCIRKANESPLNASGASVARREMSSGNVKRLCIFMHPPYKHGVGYTFALSAPVTLPQRPPAALRCMVGKGDGSDRGDGIVFRIAVVDSAGKQTMLAQRQWAEHAWAPFEADLSPWAGKAIRIKLIADVGPKDNSSGDWAGWADLRIESLNPQLRTTVEDPSTKP